jgi:hypothetical protein
MLTMLYQQPSVEDIEEDIVQPRKAIPKKASTILELADGSEDDDEPIYIEQDDSDKGEATEIDSGDEAPSESAEAELGKCPSLF